MYIFHSSSTKILRLLAPAFIFFCVVFLAPYGAHAGLFSGESPETAPLEDDLDYIVASLPGGPGALDVAKLSDLLAFAAQKHQNADKIHPKDRFDGVGTFLQFSVKAPLSRISDYFFNPKIPAEAVIPGSVRRGGWTDPAAAQQGLAGMRKFIKGGQDSFLYRGEEYEESMPDTESGSYYSYTVKRLLAGFIYEGKKTILSVSQLNSPSSVGKKAVMVGSPKDWICFFSGIKGNMLKGVGWADGYLYQSCTLSVFMESSPGKPLTNVKLFKWLRAGWAGMNMVRRKHITAGTKEYIAMFTSVMQSKHLPSVEALVARAAAVNGMSEEQLRQALAPLAEYIKKQKGANKKLGRKEFAELLEGDNYLASLSKKELRSELLKDFVRKALRGKTMATKPGAPQAGSPQRPARIQ